VPQGDVNHQLSLKNARGPDRPAGGGNSPSHSRRTTAWIRRALPGEASRKLKRWPPAPRAGPCSLQSTLPGDSRRLRQVECPCRSSHLTASRSTRTMRLSHRHRVTTHRVAAAVARSRSSGLADNFPGTSWATPAPGSSRAASPTVPAAESRVTRANSQREAGTTLVVMTLLFGM
jgi:hypothetical protein